MTTIIVIIKEERDICNDILREEWGFRGMVLSDWDGSYGYQITDNSICNGNDIMLGFNRYPTSVINDTEAATCVLALQQAAKNILYTVANSGNYTIGKACQRGNGAISCCAVSGVAVKREENGACGYNSQAPF